MVKKLAINFFKYNHSNNDSLWYQPATITELNSVLLQLNQKKNSAPGDDGITYDTLCKLPLHLKTALLNIINSSMSIAYVPYSWKHAKIILFPKPDKDHSVPGNYRPISLLTTMSKVLEKIIQIRLLNFCISKNIITEYQAGFLQSKQTKDVLFSFIQ